MGEMTVVCADGDIVVSWNPKDEASTAKARDEFERLVKDGYEMLKPGMKRKTRIKNFDEKLGEIIAVPGVKTKADKRTGARPRAMAGQPNTRRVPTLGYGPHWGTGRFGRRSR
jgi:hypothetical protein